jgi:predicted small lipoprotein YifL
VKRLVLIGSLFALSACGKVAPLEPPPGQPLPVKPAMAPRQLTAEELLQPRTDAAPSRVDELIRKSAPRRTDRFDLPPPDGGAPMLPAGTEPAATPSDKTGPGQPK